MTVAETTYSESLARLRAVLKKRCPDYPDDWTTPEEARNADRRLLEEGICTDAELVALYGKCFNLECVDEDAVGIPEEFPGLSEVYCNANTCLPLEWDEETVSLLIADPYQIEQHRFLFRKELQKKVVFFLARRTFLERMLSKISAQDKESDMLNAGAEDEDTLRTLAGEARIVRLVNDIFTRAIELGASDIHIEPGEENVSVRCRVDGVLTEILNCPLSQFPAIASRIKLIGGLNIAESRLPQDGRTTFQLGRMELDMRISTIPILTGESIVLRLLNKEAIRFDLKNLGLSDADFQRFSRLVELPHGIILVVGPTGSGKTTTLYSAINKLNDQKRKIITIEDPVEYQTPGLCQMQVNAKIGVTFAAGLRHIVRQDPDVILVGEIRDRETADIAINAALTGHLVLSTLHTNDAVGAITRLIDMGVESFLVASALYGVLSQRLVRKICSVCHGSGRDSGGNRCRHCNGTGYKGRCGIFELLTMNDEMRSAVNSNLPSSELEALAIKHGMVTLQQDGERKVRDGITTAEELARSTAEL